MTSRKSSGSSRDDSSVEPTRSQNITVNCRRSASTPTLPSPVVPGTSPGRGGLGRGVPSIGRSAVLLDVGGAPLPRAAMASSILRRCPTDVTPSSRRSSPVSRRKTSPSMSLSRNAGRYRSSPRPRNQAGMSTSLPRSSQRLEKHRRVGPILRRASATAKDVGVPYRLPPEPGSAVDLPPAPRPMSALYGVTREEPSMLEIGLFHNGASSLPVITNREGVTFNDGALPVVHRAAQETLVNQVRQGILA